YQTALIGKAHMVRKWNNAGFEHIRYCDLADSDRHDVLSNHYFKYLVDHGLGDMYEDGALPPGNDCNTQGYGIGRLPYEHAIEHWTAQETLGFLEQRDTTRPFFVHMSFERPHPNLAPAPEDADLYEPDAIVLPDCIADAYEHEFASKPALVRGPLLGQRKPEDHLKRVLAAYYTLITAIDREIGRVLEALKQCGELENTVVVYTADHGDFAGEHGVHGKNIGIYESIHRIPFILKYPGCPQGAVKDGIVESVDLYATLCELCALPVPEHVEGQSVLPVIEADSPGKEFAVCEWDWWHPYPPAHAVRTRDFRLVYYDAEHGGELYHTAADPGEIKNLWNDPDFRDIRLQLMERLFDQVARYAKLSDRDTDR
ncbi:MAG: sulfatase-like hydrolase/transferase, partial [bacterium]|nr:sulfatase-like hydrolase/transferase [bacterium]